MKKFVIVYELEDNHEPIIVHVQPAKTRSAQMFLVPAHWEPPAHWGPAA